MPVEFGFDIEPTAAMRSLFDGAAEDAEREAPTTSRWQFRLFEATYIGDDGEEYVDESAWRIMGRCLMRCQACRGVHAAAAVTDLSKDMIEQCSTRAVRGIMVADMAKAVTRISEPPPCCDL